MMGKLTEPKEIWKIHDYLDIQRRETDKKYDYRYSVFPMVFARLIEEEWITEADLQGLDQEKIQAVRTMLNIRS